MSIDLETQIRGGHLYPNRNVDITLDIDTDYSALQYLGVTIDVDNALAPVPATSAIVHGILQNVANDGKAHIRFCGVSKAICYGSVAKDDILVFTANPGYEGMVVTVQSDDLHNHNAVIPTVRHIFKIVDASGIAITGATLSDISALSYYDVSGTFLSAVAVTVTEASGGEYVAEYSPTSGGVMHRLLLNGSGSLADAIFTPAEFQQMSIYRMGNANALSLRNLAGVALEAGSDGDTILINLRPQFL